MIDDLMFIHVNLRNGPINTRPTAIITGRILAPVPPAITFMRTIYRIIRHRRDSHRGIVFLSAFLMNTVHVEMDKKQI